MVFLGFLGGCLGLFLRGGGCGFGVVGLVGTRLLPYFLVGGGGVFSGGWVWGGVGVFVLGGVVVGFFCGVLFLVVCFLFLFLGGGGFFFGWLFELGVFFFGWGVLFGFFFGGGASGFFGGVLLLLFFFLWSVFGLGFWVFFLSVLWGGGWLGASVGGCWVGVLLVFWVLSFFFFGGSLVFSGGGWCFFFVGGVFGGVLGGGVCSLPLPLICYGPFFFSPPHGYFPPPARSIVERLYSK